MHYFLRNHANVRVRSPLQAGSNFDFASQLEEAIAEEVNKFEEVEDPFGADELSAQEDGGPGVARLNEEPESAKVSLTLGSTCAKRSAVEAFGSLGPDKSLNLPNRSHRRRCFRRNKKILLEGHVPSHDVLSDILKRSCPLTKDIDLPALPATSCGYLATNLSNQQTSEVPDSLESLAAEGFNYISWEALEPRPFTTQEGVVFGAMVGLPKDPGYKAACDRLYAKLEQVGSQLQEESRSNRRGPFPVLNVGITHGKGTPHPVTLHSPLAKTPSKHVEVVEALLKDQDLVRIATFGSACFQMWAPDIFDYYKSKLDKLYARMPQLRRNFQKSVFPAAAINCGPNVWTYHHRDSMNCPFGFCAITALGRFDPKFGGHLILRGLKLVIEFPPGATILIPSAVVVHGNIPVQPGDVRASFTQYCPGGLLRFVDNHFMTEKKLKKANKTEYARLMAEKPLRWKMGLGLLSKFDDLVTRVE